MSEALTRRSRLPALTATRQRGGMTVAGAGGSLSAPLVAILGTAPRGRVAAAAIALALARAMGRSCAFAGVVGEGAGGSLGGVPSASRTARGVREHGLPVVACGRLVWLADRRGALAAEDVPGRAAAMAAELSRSAVSADVPAAIAFPFPRIAALDRVLAWHDAIVVVREPEAPAAVIERALTSLAELGRPVAAMMPPPRLPAALAARGLRAPVEAARAVAELELRDGRSGPRDA